MVMMGYTENEGKVNVTLNSFNFEYFFAYQNEMCLFFKQSAA